jgi:sensor histidine kinase YesM
MEPEKSNDQVRPMAKPYRRKMRNILIHKPMQREFSLILIGLLMVSTLAVAYVIHSTIREMAFSGYRYGKISPYEVLSDISYQLVVRVSSVLFVTLVVIAFYGVFFLHRVAGPVYRFRMTFLKINDGEVPHTIHLREGDYFTETAAEINRMIERLKFDKQKKQEIRERVIHILAANPDGAVGNAAKEIKALLEQEPNL